MVPLCSQPVASRMTCESADRLRGSGQLVSQPQTLSILSLAKLSQWRAFSAACGGFNVPGVEGQCSGQRPVLIDKLKPMPTWAGERKSLSLIRNMFLFQV